MVSKSYLARFSDLEADIATDFSIPNTTNAFGYIPTEANFIRPFKRPLSSISPTIVEFPNGSVYI
jgi:gamma-glutamyltranspeptidase/glutathione hydrolase